MGNTSKKLAAKCTLLTKDEQKYVAATFRSASKNSDKIREDDLIKFWGPQMDPRLAQYLSNFLFGCGPNKESSVDFNRFAELYVFNVRGSVDQRVQVMYNSLGKNLSDSVEVPFQLLKEYCESIASTYIKILKSSSCRQARSWLDKGFRGRAAHVQALGEAVAATIAEDDAQLQHCTHTQISKWLYSDTLLQHLAEVVFTNLYGLDKKAEESASQSEESIVHPALPRAEGLEPMPDYPAFTDLSHIVWLNNQLPRKHQHKWRFLFSSHVHGESFSTLTGRIIEQGASIIIIEDNNGHIFGGFASDSWAIGPTFYGTDESFLFTLAPKMRVFPASGFNNHFQYMNHGTKTLPNGLLMGGQFDFGAIWVNANPFGHGSSAESCTTYRNYKRLSKEASFKIRSLEVWGVGEKPLSLKESGDRDVSVLDTNPEAKAILELAGRTRHSEGLREPLPL